MADTNDIIHLLRRTEFVARASRVAALQPMTLEQAVEDVLDFSRNTTSPPAWMTVLQQDRYGQLVAMHNWWLDTMATAARPFQEKLTLFWHGHFVSDYGAMERPDFTLQQIGLYRRMAVGNFRAFTQAMSIEPVMLAYLSNDKNMKGNPNENFARELMELFTLGVGNYSQSDVVAAARAWTGHTLDFETKTYRFDATQHDTGNKTFFGTTKNWDGPEIIDEILRDNKPKQAIAARFMARKLWEFLAYPDPEQAIIDELATGFVATDLEIRPLVKAILLRPEFYSTKAKQGLVRSPVEWSVALLAHTGFTAARAGIMDRGLDMGQRLFNPPNVAGWKSNGYYLTTGMLSARAKLAQQVANELLFSGGFGYLETMSPALAVDNVAAFFGVVLAPTSRSAIIDSFSSDLAAVGWNKRLAVGNLLITMMLTGEMNVP
ncbi:MAG: DUF1800 domain-containing protein [Ilumatobacteraceae bacterium]